VSLDSLDEEQLPAEARGMSGGELRTWIDGKRTERESLKTQLAELVQARAEHVAAQAEEAAGPARLDTAIVESILSQARDAGFTIEPAA
jgi:hypothetical protein